MTDWAETWAVLRADPGVAAELERLGDTPETEAGYRLSWEATQAVLARPGVMDMLRERLAELDRKYPPIG